MSPEISVIMPVYNGEKYLKEAIESILGQSFHDYEFIIIDDGSTDGTQGIILSFADPRIVFIKNDSNIGLSRTINKGVALAKGKYIARMDADDIALPERFEKQHSFLEKHGEIGVLGSAAILIDEHGRVTGRAAKPLSHKELKWQSLFSTPLLHPTVMGRASIFKTERFDESLHNSEDYELWNRLLFKAGARLANLPDALIRYRVFPHSFTRSLKKDKREASALNTIENLSRFIDVSSTERLLIIKYRQEEPLSISESTVLIKLYRRAAKSFGKSFFTLMPFVYSLCKVKVKKILE